MLVIQEHFTSTSLSLCCCYPSSLKESFPQTKPDKESTVKQLKRKVWDDAVTKDQLLGKIKSLTKQLKCSEYELIILLDEFHKLKQWCLEDVSAANADEAYTVKMMRESHAKELLKKSELIRNLCEKNKSDRKLVNSVSHFPILI